MKSHNHAVGVVLAPEGIPVRRSSRARAIIGRRVPAAQRAWRLLRRAWTVKSHAETFDDLWSTLLTRLALATRDVFFVEVGANDGISFDPLNPHVIRHNWRGILIEPLPDLFHQLVANYRDQDGLIFENVAISETPGWRQMYRVSPDDHRSELPNWSKGLASFFKDRNALGGHGVDVDDFERIRPRVTTQAVRCDTLANILAKHGVTKVDVIQIDVEGFDYQVLRQLDLARFKPRIIRMEWVNLLEQEKREAVRLLKKHGYRIRLSNYDLLAWRNLGTGAYWIGILRDQLSRWVPSAT